MRTLIVLITFAMLTIISALKAQDISPGLTFTDGQRLTAAQLGQLVSLAQIQTAFYTGKVSQGAPVAGDVFLCYSASSGTFHKLTAASLLYNNYGIISSQTPYSTMADYSTFLFYDPSNNIYGQLNKSNLARIVSSGIVASNLVLYTTNGNQLPAYSVPFNPSSTNNQLNFVCYDTNGIPSYVTVSNFIVSIVPFTYTNKFIPYVYKQIFAPETLYGTNQMTNIWAQSTVFPITNLYMFGNTSNQTLTATDSIPIASGLQYTNTTVTIGTISQYMQSNVIPAYTTARVSFNGVSVDYGFTNSTSFGSPAIEFVLNAAGGTPFTNNVAKSFIFLGASGFASTTPQIATNKVFYGVQGSVSNRFIVFANYSDATDYISTIATNAVVINSLGTGTNRISVLPQFSGYNCDATPVGGTATVLGTYDVWFRTAQSGTNYYVSGMTSFDSSHNNATTIDIGYNGGTPLITTNRVRLDVSDTGNTARAPQRAYVLISPE